MKALFETWRQSMFNPSAFWPSVRPDGDWQDAVFYAWAISIITDVLSAIPPQKIGRDQAQRMIDMLSTVRNLPPETQALVERILAFGSGMTLVFALVLQIILYPIFLLAGAAIIHLFCMLFGCAANGFTATLRGVAYAQGPVILFVLARIPCVGLPFALIAPIYVLALTVMGIMSVQRTSPGKATAAALAPIVIICCCCPGLLVALAGMIGALFPSGG